MIAVMSMIATDMTGHPSLQEETLSGLSGRLHDKVRLIRYHTESKDLDELPSVRRGQQVEESRVVAVLVDGGRATIEPIVSVSDDLPARNPRCGDNGTRSSGQKARALYPVSLSVLHWILA